MRQLKYFMWAVVLLHLSASRADSGYSYQPPYNQIVALPQENGNYYQPPHSPLPVSPQQNFNGYEYPRPPSRIPILPAENMDFQLSNNESVATPPPGVMGDFIDDIINGQKEQILSSLLGNTEGAVGLGDDDDAKAFRFNKCATCTCGVPNVNRIIGGTVVRINKYPWTAQLIRDNFVYCGGTLINDRYVLTAAHCVKGQNVKRISVRLLQLGRSTNMGIMRRAVALVTHKKYNDNTLVNDIALVKLSKPIALKDPIRPVCLPNPNQNFDFKEGVIAGWGLTSQDGDISSVLQEVTVPIITNAQCRNTSYKTMIVNTMLCAGLVEEGGKDACQGDSGGPLIVRDRIFQLAGVVSFGFGCAKPNAPGVYTRVSQYLKWISENTKDACYCKQ
ncbi:trypsin-1 [Anastrepha obliqua]|uniref:trypsin-1 n=1 Tax=Anastrepha obliqua TaxID=95512 RepID=UPI002408FBBB|nr:trypsin-1 [Anastrepha obliqua]